MATQVPAGTGLPLAARLAGDVLWGDERDFRPKVFTFGVEAQSGGLGSARLHAVAYDVATSQWTTLHVDLSPGDDIEVQRLDVGAKTEAPYRPRAPESSKSVGKRGFEVLANDATILRVALAGEGLLSLTVVAGEGGFGIDAYAVEQDQTTGQRMFLAWTQAFHDPIVASVIHVRVTAGEHRDSPHRVEDITNT